jgi:hypothetical protein
MGGIVAAETLLSILSELPIPYKATSTPYPSSTTNASSTSTSVPPNPQARPASPPHTFMFPYIQGVLAFDTPYLGISPGVIAYGAESQYQSASKAYSALSSAASAFGWGAGEATPSSSAAAAAAALPAGPESAKEALAASADAAASPAWSRWGKLAMFAGAAGAVAAGSAAAYMNRSNISMGWNWATSHLEFVGCLMRGEELKTRITAMISSSQDRGIGFTNLFTVLGKGATDSGVSVAGGFIEIGGTDGKHRTFCNLPTKKEWKTYFEPAVNNKAPDEVRAHMNMFLPRENPDYYRMADKAKTRVVDWVDEAWYAGSTWRQGPVAGEEPVIVEK